MHFFTVLALQATAAAASVAAAPPRCDALLRTLFADRAAVEPAAVGEVDDEVEGLTDVGKAIAIATEEVVDDHGGEVDERPRNGHVDLDQEGLQAVGDRNLEAYGL